MKLFNIINESKSFILILLFTFTLVITSQSFASSKNDEDDLAKLCAPDDLTTLNDDDKKKCVGWCKIETNWVAKCAKIGVEKTQVVPIGKPGAAGVVDITLKTKIIKALNSLNNIATGLKVPDIYNNIYSFKIKLDKSLRPTLFEHMKPKDLSTDAEAIDKTVVSDTMKEILLDGLGYSDLKADGKKNNDKLEKFFIDFRNKWLKFEAKGSTTDTNVAFEPSTFKALASENHANQGPMHQIYNMLEVDKKIFSNTIYDSVINKPTDVATELKNLRDAIVTFIKDQLIIEGSDTWAPNTDLEFSIKLSLKTFLDELDVATFDVTNKDHFDKIKDYFTPMTLYTSDNIRQYDAKLMAGHGFLVLSGGDFNYDLNLEKVAAGAVGDARNFTEDEKNTQEYKVYAARLKAFEAGLKERFASGIDYGTPEAGSLLHKITELVRDRTQPAADNSAFKVFITSNFSTDNFGGGYPAGDGVIHKVGFIGGKWVVLIYGEDGDGRKTKMQMITEPPALGNPPRFTVQAPSTYISADFWGTGPNRANPEQHTFDALSGNGLAVGTNLFTREKLLTNAIVRTASNGILHTAVPDLPNNASDLKLIKFRLMNTHGLPDRTMLVNLFSYERIFTILRTFNKHFINNNTFGTDTDKVFADLTKFNPALGQLYAFNQFTYQLLDPLFNEIIMALNVARDLPHNFPGIHYISTHVVDPNTTPDDITLVYTCKFMRNR